MSARSQVQVEDAAKDQVSPTRIRRALDLAVAHPYLAVLAVALLARASTAMIIWAFLDGSIYDDDAFYTRIAIERARGETAGWDEYTHWLFDHTSTMMIPLTLLYRVVGSSTLPGQLLIAGVGAAVAGLGARLFWSVGGRVGALAAGLIIAVLPSQVVLSSVTLKDAPVWAVLVAISLLMARSASRNLASEAVTPVGIAILLVLLAHLRLHTCVTAAIAVAGASLLLSRRRDALRTVGVVAAALLTPWLLGLGPLGISFVTDHAGSIDAIRTSNARGEAAIAAATTTTTVEGRTTSTTADPRPDDGSTGERNLAYLPHGVFALLLEPLPWRAGDVNQRLAAVETVVWYPLLVFAAIGLGTAVRRRVDVLAFPIIVGGGTLLMWGLIEGNIGTAYRHRGEFAWVVCLLAVLGISQLGNYRDRRLASA